MGSEENTAQRKMKLYTIGSQKKSAKEFFTLLKNAGVRRIIDVRLENSSHLLSFTRVTHLPYLLREVGGIDSRYEPKLAPTREILDAWRGKEIAWAQYVARFVPVLKQRKIETLFKPADLDHACLLCSEPTPERCHRKLIAEYLCDRWADNVKVEILHL